MARLHKLKFAVTLPALAVVVLAIAIFATGALSTTTSQARAAGSLRSSISTSDVSHQSLPQVFVQMPEHMRVNHGKYDNRLTALYEQWLAGEDITAAATSSKDPNRAFSPLYGPDVDMSTLSSGENEYQIDINPLNTLFAVAGSNDGLTAGVGIYRTSDGGLSWVSFDAPIGTTACCDPAVAYGPDGTVYVGILDTSPAGQYTLRSTDNGVTWTNLGLLSLPDRNQIATDPTNPNVLYTFYFGATGSGQIEGYKSTDRGATWGAPFTVSDVPPAAGYQQSPAADVASNGWVYVGYQEYVNSSAGCSAGVRNGVARSTDGGATWSQSEFAIVQGGACSPSQLGRGVFCINAGGSSFRSRSHPIVAVNPTNPQVVYVAYSGGELELPYTCAASTGFHSDMLFRKSTDAGATFSAPTRINSDPLGKDQYYGWIDVAPNGRIWVGWHDRREDPNNFQHRWYQAYSTDGGTTWSESPVADIMSQPTTFIGDYAGLAAKNDRVLGMWYDSRGDPYTDPDAPIVVTPTVPPTVTPLATVSGTVTPCPIQFSDVPSSNTFYSAVRCLACRGIISGYSDGTFRPNNQVTRGQLAKMVSNSAGFSEAVSGQTFADVPPAHTFYEFIERLAVRGHMSGYTCGGPGEPCVGNRPYFRPQANATRGQTSKIVSNAAGFTEAPVGQTFEDVPPSNTFYEFIQRLASRGVMGGYACGGPGEPCTSGRPYFRPNNDVTRGQSAKIVANTFVPGCDPPARP